MMSKLTITALGFNRVKITKLAVLAWLILLPFSASLYGQAFTDIGAPLPGVSSSSVAWGDYDNDGDLDILLTGDSSSVRLSRVYRNDVGRFVDIKAPLAGVSSGVVAWGDYDNDGDLDILLAGYTSSSGISKIYQNNGGIFVDIRVNLITAVSSGAWGDYDNDGDLDILLTGVIGLSPNFSLFSVIYRNVGGRFDYDFDVNLRGVYESSVAWGDYDNDKDLDILLTGNANGPLGLPGGLSEVYRNQLGSFEVDTKTNLIGVFDSSVAWGDYDNDGDLDILLTGLSFGVDSYRHATIYRNNAGSFINVGTINLQPVTESSVAWGDYDNDGDLDILLTGSSALGPVARIYQNNDGSFDAISAGLTGVENGSVAWGDYDNDGDLDVLLTGMGSNSTRFAKIYRNNTTTPNTAPSSPANLTSAVTGNTVNLNWNKATDGQTAQNALTYNLRVGTTPGGTQIVSPMANVGSGYRKLPQLGNTNHNNGWTIKNLPPGKYFWSVQAIDNAFAGSAFAQEDTFRITLVNQPPAVANAIPDTTLATGGLSFTRDLNASPEVFSDPNGDALTYTAGSSDTTKAKASVSGSTLTVTPVATGMATIIVTADDQKNGMAADTFKVTIVPRIRKPDIAINPTSHNYSIVAPGSIVDKTFVVSNTGDTTLSVSGTSIIGTDASQFSIQSGGGAFSLAPQGSRSLVVRFAPTSGGNKSATLRIASNDSDENPFDVPLTGGGNRPPFVTRTIPDTTVTLGKAAFVRNLSASPAVFSDPDGDNLTYLASSSATSIATANISGSTITVAPVAAGIATIIVTANDGKGGSAADTFRVTVNRSPIVANIISPITLIVGDTPFTRNLNAAPPVFTDPDNDALTYTASSSVTNVATASIAGSTLTVMPVAAGSATITVMANDGNGGSAQTTFTATVNADSESPKILTVDALSIVDLNTSITISANVTDNVGVQKVKLFYREGGKAVFDSTEMSSLSQDIYRATIPSSFAGTRGVEFKIQAADGATNQASTARQSVRVRLPDKHLSKAQAGGSAENAYRLISVPVENNNPDFASILLDDLGPADTTKWRAWDIDPQRADTDFPYREYPAVGPLAAGKAIFLITKENKTLTSGAGVTVITTDPFNIALKPGWNMIASPFNFDIPIQNVKPDSLRDDLYAYNGAFASFPNFLKPWEGYMIKVKAPVTLTIQPSETPQSVIAKVALATDWFLRLQATCERASDVDNLIGVVKDAATEWDRYERFEPPPIGKYVMVSFPRRDWQRYPDVYTTDFRPPSSDGHVWDFAVSSNISGKPVTLRFDNLESAPPEYEIKLVDLSLKLAQDLRRETQYVFRANNSESKKTFRLLIGKTDFIAERSVSVTAAPSTYELAPNFPNPFNPSTSIKFGLPEKSRVSLRIYNLAGNEVATLFDGVEKEAGYHTAIWEGKDRQGNAMPSGIYFYRLIVGNAVLTKKMTLIK